MAAMERIVDEHLPETVGVEWSGLSYQEKHESGQTGMVLALAFLFVFLFLAAQYESWSVPIAVILFPSGGGHRCLSRHLDMRTGKTTYISRSDL